MREHIRQPLGRSQVRRIHRRAEQPHTRLGCRGRRRLQDVVVPHQVSWQRNANASAAHQRDDVVEVLRELLDVGVVPARRAAQRDRGDGVGAGRPADAEVDAAGVRGLQQCELFGDGKRRVVGQHDAARADPDLRGVCGQMGDQHWRAGGRHRGHVVVLGHPVAGVAQSVGGLCELGRRRQRVGRRLVGAHGDEVENGKPHNGVNACHHPFLPAISAWLVALSATAHAEIAICRPMKRPCRRRRRASPA